MDRRQFLRGGIGALGPLACLPTSLVSAAEVRHHPATAQRVILLFMAGGPSQVDTFDPKPELSRFAGQDVPDEIAGTVPRIQRAGLRNLMASPWKFQQHGQSGIPVSELLPHTARQVDELCIIRSMHHRNPVHGPGECVALTGTGVGDRPSIGAWTIYGLGSETSSLPAFVTMNLHPDGMQFPQAAGWGPGFLPPRFQATVVDPLKGIQHVKLPRGTTAADRRRQLSLLEWFHREQAAEAGATPEQTARARSYRLAFELQASAPELFAIQSETGQTQQEYGFDVKACATVARGCLLARRMVERGVRFVQVRVGGWDAHSNIKVNHERLASRTDQPIAALLADLKRRGLLDSTLVIWAGEFGRTPTMEARSNGRDHSPAGYTVWLAGGGVRGGAIFGATDPLGYVATENPVSPHDLHATILHALGVDANRLVYSHHGREEVPTVFGGQAVREIFS